MQNNISFSIANQISERVYTEYPLFVSFMSLYYEYAQIRTNSIGIIQNRSLDTDIDLTLEAYIDEFLAVFLQ